MKSKKLTVVLVTILGFLLAVQVGLTLFEGGVHAQGMRVERFMIVVGGTWKDNEEPLFIINPEKQVICVYEYNGEENRLKLVAVRSYKWDAMIQEYSNDAPSVQVVKSSTGSR